MSEESKRVVEDTARSLFYLAATIEHRSEQGEFSREEVLEIAKRLRDHAIDLQLAASRL